MVTNKQAMAALDAYTDSLTQLQNVIGVGIIQLGTNRSSDQAIGVYVEKKVPIEELDQSDMVPEVLVIEVDDQSVEIPTRVIEQGPVSKETL
jgi:hypothetical protein